MSIIYMGGFIVFAIPASFLIHKTGITYSLRIASLLVIVGSLMKIIKVRSPSFLLVSQAIMSFSQAIILSMATVTVARWFPIRNGEWLLNRFRMPVHRSCL